MTILSPDLWWSLHTDHVEKARQRSAGHEARRRSAENHAIEDFLWEYYPLRPGLLARWHPGAGVGLRRPPSNHVGAEEYEKRLAWRWHREVDGVLRLDLDDYLAARGRGVRFIHDLTRSVLDRTPTFACFGWHEWCMVYGGEKRHDIPLRLGQAGTDRAVDSAHVRCSHYDAFRFFTEPAMPHNTVHPTRERVLDMEQGGCLHTNMDLLKWCLQLGPAIPGDLLLDVFDLAREIRWMDMAAAPYDLSGLGLEPIPIETTEGRVAYVSRQKEFAGRAHPLRERLHAITIRLAAVPEPGGNASDETAI